MDHDDGFNYAPPTLDPPLPQYSPQQEAHLKCIEQEAADLFPKGKMYFSIKDMRDQLRELGNRKGFGVTTVRSKLCCTRCDEPQSDINKREKKIAHGLVPEESRRIFKSSTRCGCPFQITFRRQTTKEPGNKSIVITGSCIYNHGNGCFPSRDQLQLANQKAGVHTRAVVKEHNIKPILAVLNTNQHVAAPLLRDLVRPLFPPGHSLHAQFLGNFRRQARNILENEEEDDGQMDMTTAHKTCATNDLPEYLTKSFVLFNELIREAESKPTDIEQVECYLRSFRGGARERHLEDEVVPFVVAREFL
jgi:hypothetical protein